MDEQIRLLKEATDRLIGRIGELEFEELVEFVELREQIITEMKRWEQSHALLPKHRQAIRELETYNQQIIAKMTILRNEASLKLKQMSQGQLQRNAYDGAVSTDSYFIDKRK
ncbi:hypothetical protein [Paenibacillus sp. YYML68]|uniref:hypothetical protein n=1 Tax=Paenibacillus sp. YYML68 TaxID=2909250 RepID=UPI0024907B5F|nr:hypothetical protein [Paenibacillus sp. YYML68]